MEELSGARLVNFLWGFLKHFESYAKSVVTIGLCVGVGVLSRLFLTVFCLHWFWIMFDIVVGGADLGSHRFVRSYRPDTRNLDASIARDVAIRG